MKTWFLNSTGGPTPLQRGPGVLRCLTWMMSFALLAASGVPGQAALRSTPMKVELREANGQWRLYCDDKPFYIKGAGIEFGSPEKLRQHGGNSFRTWSTDNGRNTGKEVLDRALSNGLYVAMGLDVDHERRGFDYDNPEMVARQFESLKAQVLEYKDHPALLMWVVGNELNFEKNPKVWDAVNELSKMIHAVDPNHPTTTTLAGFNLKTVSQVQTRAPDLDFLSFQMYYDIINLPRYLREARWDKPYLITEWGATGHWECGKTAWGAPIENDSSTKAALYAKRFHVVIEPDQRLCLGSYVFLWGNKQERTPTWYGMFLDSGEETAAVDVMHYLWTGAWPTNRSPGLEGIWLDGRTATQNVHLRAGETYQAKVAASDPDRDVLTYKWEVRKESTSTNVGGDAEHAPPRVPGLIADDQHSEICLQAPEEPGAYRLFAYIYDGKGHAAHANIPFYVDALISTRQASATQFPEAQAQE